ncbi:hypothetical protein EHS17_08135 [Rhodobacteraceae bacterium CH30]|nr:hypothetical protein EHS17_08135 [Rhodobacteraceae bacterium CH30]
MKQQSKFAKKRSLRAVSMTLTYRSNDDFAAKNISDFLARLRQMLKRKGQVLPYVWVLEHAQQLHYHLMLWLPRNIKLDVTKLTGWWPWGSTWLASCQSIKAWGRYMTKFTRRSAQMHGARLFGYGGLDEQGKMEVARAGMPRWLTNLLPYGHHARRSPGGGWASVKTGEIHRSPYVWTPRGAVLRESSGLGVGACQVTG